MSKLNWYWHRLRAMSAGEIALHARKKFRQFTDARWLPDWSGAKLEGSGAFPKLPKPEDAPAVLREALRRDTEDILAGRWKAFGHLELQVDDPPRWHKDYLVGKDFTTNASAFKLDHRTLPEGADIKLIWELSRWYQLVRLAMAAYVLNDEHAARKCVEWLEDWVKHNPPYRGWNWTSALESGMRLIQFTWIDGLLITFVKSEFDSPSPRPSPPGRGRSSLAASSGEEPPIPSSAGLRSPSPGGEGRGEGGRSSDCSLSDRLGKLRREILPAHVWFTWRHKSFGSSANNHLLGELTGLILATVRWPELTRWGAPLNELQRRWEHEVLAQFAGDGGNKEQALNYQLFAWELCWQAGLALKAAAQKVRPAVEARLNRSGRFFWEVQATSDIWDYGDSDNAFVTPFFTSERTVVPEWRAWMEGTQTDRSLAYWLNEPPTFSPPLGRGFPAGTIVKGDWWLFPDTGIATCESGMWWLRWDLSPLGHLSTAAHGHLDALHVSIWFQRTALVVDPGTGAYYANRELRNWLTSRAAHNGPCPEGPEFPKRLGPFLWSQHHLDPVLKDFGSDQAGVLNLPERQLRRRVNHSPDGLNWAVEDSCTTKDGKAGAFTVRWQFAPGTWIKVLSPRRFSVNRADVSVVIEVDENWADVRLVETEADRPADAHPLEGIVSPAFRKTVWAPYLKLKAPAGDQPCVFRTTFLASARA